MRSRVRLAPGRTHLIATQLRIIIVSALPVDVWDKLLGDTASVTALLDWLLHHAHALKCGSHGWRTKMNTDFRPGPLPQ